MQIMREIDDPSVAWDLLCAKEEEALRALRRENPGCGECTHGIPCPCGCGWVWCTAEGDFVEEYQPSCEYEGYE